MGENWESATVGGNGYGSENSDWAVHPVGQQTFPAPEQIELSFAWEEKQRELELWELKINATVVSWVVTASKCLQTYLKQAICS